MIDEQARALRPSRRSVLRWTGAAAAMAAAKIPVGAAAASCDRVVVGTWGGDYANLLDELVAKPLERGHQITTITDIGPATPRKTKLLAEKDRRRGSVDVVCLGDHDMYQMARRGVMADVTAADVPNLDHVLEQFRRPYAVPHIFSARVIVYNSEHMRRPESYADLWHPNYAGKIGFSDLLAVSVLESAALAAGGSATDYEPGKAKLIELRRQGVKIYPSNETLAAALKTGEVWATIMWRARAYQWRKAGIPVDSVAPAEGATPITFEAAMARNAPSPDCGRRYLDAMLAPEAQVRFAEGMGYVPTVGTVALPPELRAELDFTADERAKFFRQDFEYLDRNNAKFLDWWNKDFKG